MPDKKLLEETSEAICSQFALANISSRSAADERYEILKQTLSKRITEMINHEFDHFVNLLYRIDVNESKVKEALAEKPFTQGIEKVAEMIIQRQLEKIATKKQFSASNHDLEFDI